MFAQIRRLEEQIGTKLYERVGKRLKLTNHGGKLAEHAEKIVDAHNDALAEMQELEGGGSHHLRIGCGPHTSLRVLPHLLEAFLKLQPHTEINLATGDDEFLLRELRGGVLDAILMSLPIDATDLDEHALWAYEMIFAAPAQGDSSEKAIQLADLADRQFIRYHRPIIVDAAIKRLSKEAGFEPRVAIEHDNPDSIRELVKLGIGYAVLPYWCVAEEEANGNLRVFRTSEPSVHHFGLAFRKAGYHPGILDDLLEVAQNWNTWWPLARFVSAAPQG